MNTSPTEPRTPRHAFAVPRAGQPLPPQRPDPREAGYELRFRSLFDEGRALAFPCDAQGHVDMDTLSPRALRNYLYARTVVGREFFMPAVLPQHTH